MYRDQILKAALDARKREVVEYQVNIDNFKLAIECIGDDVELQQFKEQLCGLLTSNLLEQKKAQIMLKVVQSQLEGA